MTCSAKAPVPLQPLRPRLPTCRRWDRTSCPCSDPPVAFTPTFPCSSNQARQEGASPMSRHSSSRRGRRNKTTNRRRNRAIGTGSALGTFLALGMAPLASNPAANADVLDTILDPIINSLGAIDPTMGADLLSVVDTFDPTFVLDSTASAATSLDAAASAATSSSIDYAQIYNEWIYTPIHTIDQAWINSSFGEQVDNALNQWSGLYLIGNGVDGTALDPNGGDAGLWMGDGGIGYDESANAGVAGGDGGAGGLIGD